MANDALWTKTTNGTHNPVPAAVQLSDGTSIIFAETASGTYVLYYTTDHATLNTIATFTGGYSTDNIIGLAVDLFGNIFITMCDATKFSESAAAIHAQAFIKGTGYSWTAAGTWMLAANPYPIYGATSSSLVWCNTSGGLNGAGHLAIAVRGFSGGAYQDFVVTVDAGVLLAGSGTPYVGVYPAGSSGGSGAAVAASISPDGFGATSGLVAFYNVPSNGVFPWNISVTGVVTYGTAVIVGLTTGLTPPVAGSAIPQLIRVNGGLWGFTYDSTASGPTIIPITSSSIAVSGSPVVTSDPVWQGMQEYGWDAFASAVTPGRMFIIGFDYGSGVPIPTIYHIGANITATTVTYDAAVGIDDTSFGTAASPSTTVIACAQPFVTVIDFMAITVTGGVYTLNGGVSYADGGSGNAPALLSPVNNSYLDTSAGVPVTWDYNEADGATQTAFAFRYKIAGAPNYLYWNVAAGTSSTTPVWNPSTTQGFTVPAAAMHAGQGYSWSVATQSVTRVRSSFAPDNFLVANPTPVVAVSAPSGVVTSTMYPTVTWSESLLAKIKQTAYRVVVYSAAQYTAGGFVPGVGPSTYDSGVQTGSATSFTIPISAPMLNNTNYRAYVIVTVTGGQSSAFAFSAFSLLVLAPAQPTLVAIPSNDPVTGAPRISLSVQGLDNIMTAQDSSFETGPPSGGYVPTNCTIPQSAAQALSGTKSMAMTASSAGNMSAAASVNPGAVKALTRYTAVASFRAAATARTVQVSLVWQDAGHSTISTVAGATASDGTSGFTQANASGIAPANAAFAYVIVTVTSAANGEVHYVDCVGIFQGTSTSWTINNRTGYTASIYYSDDNVTWFPVRGAQLIPDPSGAGLIAPAYDYESVPLQNRYYRAQIISGGVGGFSSPFSSTVYAAADPGVWWWLKDPVDPSVALRFNQGSDIVTHFDEKATMHTLLGRQNMVKVSDGIQGEAGTASLVTDDDATYRKLLLLIRRPGVLLLQSPFGYQWYMNIDTTSGASRQVTLPSYLLNFPMRTTQLAFAEADAP